MKAFMLVLCLVALFISDIDTACYFEQYFNDTQITSNKDHVKWSKRPVNSSEACLENNPHKMQGMLAITVPDWTEELLITLYQDGPSCDTSFHLARHVTNGVAAGGVRANKNGLWIYHPTQTNHRIDTISNFMSKEGVNAVNISISKAYDFNILEIFKYEPVDEQVKINVFDSDIFELDDLLSGENRIFLSINNDVDAVAWHSRRDEPQTAGAGLYYVCIKFNS